jgi:hypothetical protein
MRSWPTHAATEQSATGDDPLAACERAILSVRSKANHNEHLARMSTGAIILASALIPVSLIGSNQADAFLLGKLVPALLAAIAAVAAGVIQFERPHERWKLYRGYQRALEIERFLYQNEIGCYDCEAHTRARALAEQVAHLKAALHQEWSGLLASTSDLAPSRSSPKPPGGL